MSLLRIIPTGSSEKKSLKKLINYVLNPAKHVDSDGSDIPANLLIGSWGVNLKTPYNSLIMPHVVFGYPGKRLFYHVLLDFTAGNIPVDPLSASNVSKQICKFLMNYEIQYIFGVHTLKGNLLNPLFWSHCHVIVNAIQFSTGKKFHLGKKILWEWKNFMNEILKKFNLDTISVYQEEK